MSEQDAKRTAYRHLNRHGRVLAPASAATVTFPAFDPVRAAMPLAIVVWPCWINCRPTVLTHAIFDGDQL